MTAIDRATRDRFRYQLPYPLASSYKRLCACPEPNEKRLYYALKTAEMVARYLGVIALADLRRMEPPGGLGTQAAELARGLASPSFGTWLWILRTALVAARGVDRELFMPELHAFHFDARGKPTESIRRLETLLVIRNRFTHDKLGPDERLQPRQIPQVCEQAVVELEEVLAAVSFLIDYPLVVVSPATVKKRRGEAPRYLRNKIVMAGFADPFEPDPDQVPVPEICETEEALLLHPRGDRYLNLDPLIVYSNEGIDDGATDGRKSGIFDIFVYNGGRPGHRTYMACSRGGQLSSREATDGAHLDAAFAELTQVLGVAEPT